MGFLRFFLAIIVIFSHTSFFGIDFIGGKSAVELFFIISGFYMAMILNEKYIGKNSYYIFIKNRILRLYPIYGFILIIGVIISIIGGLIVGNWGYFNQYLLYYDILDFKTLVLLIFTNIFIIGQDIVSLININLINGDLSFILPANNMMFRFIPQSWTLAVEFSFYIIAPFIVRSNIKYIFFILLLSLLLRIFIYINYGEYGEYLIYILLPTQLSLFLIGVIAYRFKNKLNNLLSDKIKTSASILFFILLFFSDFFEKIGLNINIISWLIYLVSIIVIPYLFYKTREIKFDNSIGNLSYPIYIVHSLIIFILIGLNLNIPNFLISVLTIILSIFMSIFLIKFIDNPINKIRQQNIKKF